MVSSDHSANGSFYDVHFAKEETYLVLSTQVLIQIPRFLTLSINFNEVARHTRVILTSLQAPTDDGYPSSTTLPSKRNPRKHFCTRKDFNKTRKGQIPKQTKSTHSPPWGRMFTPVLLKIERGPAPGTSWLLLVCNLKGNFFKGFSFGSVGVKLLPGSHLAVDLRTSVFYLKT